MTLQIELPRPHHHQKTVLLHPARHKVLIAGRRWGKSTLAMIYTVEGALRGGRFWWVSPTFKMSATHWRALKELLKGVIAHKSEHEKYIQLATGGEINIKSADDADSLRGDGLDGAVIDEAAMISDPNVWHAALRPALADREGSSLIITTPKGRNWVYYEYLRGQEGHAQYMSWQFPTSSAPTVRMEEIEAARASLPSDVFSQEFLANFCDDGGIIFRSIDQCIAAMDGQPYEGKFVAGVDWGQSNDYTVCTVVDKNTRRVVDLDRFNQLSWEIQRGRVKAMVAKWGASPVYVEENAIGRAHLEALQHDGVPAIGFTMTNSSKAELVNALTLAFEQGTIGIPDNRALKAELQSFEGKRLPSGRWQYSAPSGMHDDMVISLMLALHGCGPLHSWGIGDMTGLAHTSRWDIEADYNPAEMVEVLGKQKSKFREIGA